MKNTKLENILISIIFIISGLCVTSASATVIVSFQTTVTHISGATTIPISLGQTFNYELLFDTNADAYRINDVGTRIDMPDYDKPGYSYDQFYADLVSNNDNLLGDENNGVTEWNRGFFRTNLTGTNHMTALDVDDMLEMSIFSIENQFDIGAIWSSHRKFKDPVNGSMFYNGRALLTGIRSAGVPEPTILVLIGLGLAGIGVARRRKISV